MTQPCTLPVKNPQYLPSSLPSELIELPGDQNFKPSIAAFDDGELLLYCSHHHTEDPATDGKLTIHPVLFRSTDGGRTWSRGRHIPELVGAHEPYVTIIDGVVFVTTHFYPRPKHDAFAGADHAYCGIFRSLDRGETYEAFRVDGQTLGSGDLAVNQTSRNIFQLADGRLMFCVDHGARSYVFHSEDLGASWSSQECTAEAIHSVDGGGYGLMGENVMFYAPSGRLMMLARLDYTRIRLTRPLAHDPHYSRHTGLDQLDGEILFESPDGGVSWQPVRAVGFPALMYPSMVDLGGHRQLFSYTVREVPPDGMGCIHPRVGVQAIVVEEGSDGVLDFDLSRDVVVIDDCTPASQRNAGCFGNTLRLADGTFVTPYSFPKIDPEILALADSKAYMRQEVFDEYASRQTAYSFRYADLVRPDPELTEMLLRRSFSALFLYAQCMNLGGIGTRVARWHLSPPSVRTEGADETAA
jgi:hypothetical protein